MTDPISMLIAPTTPRFWLTYMQRAALDTLRSRLIIEHPETLVRVLRGQQMHSKPSVLNELAAALQFPLYFGQNWDALADLLADLSWHQFQSAVLLIADAEHVLMHADDFATPFFDILRERAESQTRQLLTCIFQVPNTSPSDEHQVQLFVQRLARSRIVPAYFSS